MEHRHGPTVVNIPANGMKALCMGQAGMFTGMELFMKENLSLIEQMGKERRSSQQA